jgi:hypothetical protein
VVMVEMRRSPALRRAMGSGLMTVDDRLPASVPALDFLGSLRELLFPGIVTNSERPQTKRQALVGHALARGHDGSHGLAT